MSRSEVASAADAPEGLGTADVNGDPVLDPRIQESIGRSLKAHYDDLINAPVPDRFLALLAELEVKEAVAGQGNGDERH